jgi:hypothetical protein
MPLPKAPKSLASTLVSSNIKNPKVSKKLKSKKNTISINAKINTEEEEKK